MSSYLDRTRPVSIDLTRSIKPTSPGLMTGRLTFATVSLPVFSISGIPWLGASFIAIEFPVNFGEVITLLKPLAQPASPNFCLAIRWLDAQGLVVRRKLWEDVGEVLAAPIYNGENINFPCTFEVWTCLGKATVSLSSALAFSINKAVSRLACVADCTEVAENTDTSVRDVLFSPYLDYFGSGLSLPITLTETLIQVINRQ